MSEHLIHIGYPKAGSTFLQRWFEAHPQIAYVEGGIAGYGSVHDMVTQAVAPADAVRCRVTSREGFAIPDQHYGRSDFEDGGQRGAMRVIAAEAEACRALAALFPTARILIVTRGFRSMILSSYSQYVRMGGALGLAEIAANAAAASPWNYDRLIGRYREAFGADRVLVLPYELLRGDGSAFLAIVETWTGLDHFPGPSGRVNEALTPVELAWYPRLAKMAGNVRPRRLSRHYARLAFKGRLRPVVQMLQRLRPRPLVTADLLSDEMVEAFRGQADSLRVDPLYAPYAEDYLL